jgi:phage gp29-like protein
VIVDLYGNEIRTAELAEPQTAGPSLAYLPRTFQGHPSRGLTPQRLATILEDAERFNLIDQSELWLDIREKWGHCDAEMGRRERALLTLERSFVPPDGANRAEKKATAFLNDVFDSFFAIGTGLEEEPQDAPSLDSVILGCADAMGHGFSAQELTWRREEKRWLPGAIEHRPQNWFRLDVLTHSKLRLRDLSSDGAKLRPGGWILHKHRARSGYVSRSGLVRSLAWPYLFANFSIRDLAELLEIYGLPILIGKHPANATEAEKRKLLQAVTGIGHNAGGIVPESMLIEALKTSQASSADLFKMMIDWAEATASKIITGQHYQGGKTATESLERTEVKADLTTTDARQIDQTLTAFGWLILQLNPEGQCVERLRTPRHKFDTAEVADVRELADALPKLVAVGGNFSKRWLNEKTKIPEPVDDEDRLVAQAPVQVPAVDATSQQALNLPPAAAKVAALAAGKAGQAQIPVSTYAAQLAERAAGPLAEWEAVLRAEVEQCQTAEDVAALKARLPELFQAMNSGPLAELYAEALECAELAGRFDVQQGH